MIFFEMKKGILYYRVERFQNKPSIKKLRLFSTSAAIKINSHV